MDPIGIMLALRATDRLAHSARPEAPVAPDDPEVRAGPPPPGPLRRGLAHGLRSLADRLAPDPAFR